MKVAIFTNKPYEKCETFIKAQIDLLEGDIFHYWSSKNEFLSLKDLRIHQKILRRLRPTKDPIKVSVKRLKRDKVQIVLAQYGMIGVEALEVCQHLDLPLVVHFHGHDAVRQTIINTYQEKYSVLFKYKKLKVISVSPVMTQKLIGLGCPEEKIVYNPYGPHNSFLELKPEYVNLQCLAIGRFVPKKAPQHTIKAFSMALKDYPKATLIMAGDGELLDDCKQLAIDLNIEKQVLFPGRVTPETFKGILEESRIFLQHSVTAEDGDMEGTPVSILEAQAAGLPVVSTYHAGIPNVVLHNKTGYLVEEHDVSGMGDYIKDLLENRAKVEQMGVEGRKHIKENFTIDRYLQKLQHILNL